MISYTIAICNYNMADTLEESLRSVLDQIDERFEVLVVDGGSTDGSIEILKSLESECDTLRYILLPKNPRRKLGEDRHISVVESQGEHVLLHVDTDDRYEDGGIVSLVEVYEQIYNQVDFEFGLTGSHITIAPREFILSIGSYRNVAAAEDLDLWRRMMARDGFINLDCEPFWTSIGYNKSKTEKLKRIINQRESEFKLGTSYSSRLQIALSHSSMRESIIDIITSTIGYIISTNDPRMSVPNDMKSYEKFIQTRKNNTFTLKELEKKFDIDIIISKIPRQDIFYDKNG